MYKACPSRPARRRSAPVVVGRPSACHGCAVACIGQRPRPSRGPAPRDLDARGWMDRKLRSVAGQAIYALRKTIVEPVFGQIKGARGLDRFRLRGLEKVNGEWALMATTHNLRKLFRVSVATS
ncbi:transposase [Cyanobium sp. FGCU-52]|nr:transposase [Cyanobium sp. FGCU52]